jgi:hypothetical protein
VPVDHGKQFARPVRSQAGAGQVAGDAQVSVYELQWGALGALAGRVAKSLASQSGLFQQRVRGRRDGRFGAIETPTVLAQATHDAHSPSLVSGCLRWHHGKWPMLTLMSGGGDCSCGGVPLAIAGLLEDVPEGFHCGREVRELV